MSETWTERLTKTVRVALERDEGSPDYRVSTRNGRHWHTVATVNAKWHKEPGGDWARGVVRLDVAARHGGYVFLAEVDAEPEWLTDLLERMEPRNL